ncbi:hypothetical protein PS425_06720 [Limosilactobacillus fermentum]|uniref:hypothetical protein n=1 Tax=Limosilactobacillus fermentum TaxID=1613 RepID=UPI000710B5F2|nr:hypothetical protein [Limosilactobacillus fermentum]MBD9349057.1 hypothetical protein [Limosilactobacillus fermentum]SJM56292.1 hypothetical protein FM122_07270 [Limosilactobacillus fermentum]SJM62834.1 hypothetical protein FM123_09410 [Limosilactobacillus fermentum]
MTEFNYQLNPVQVDPSGHYDFQNVFDFPDFIEMRPVLREAVRQVAKEGVKEPTLPVQVERMATALEEQLERCTRKYERQAGYYPNQKKEKNELSRLFTHVLQAVSARDEIDQDIEDLVYAVNQTRLSIIGLPLLEGEGPLYSPDQDQELLPGTFYYLVALELVRPYLKDPKGGMVPENVTKKGRDLVLHLTTYAYRDWDSYLTHQYDEKHAIENQKGLTNVEYYDRLEENERHYADHAYADVLADLFGDLEQMLVPTYCDHLSIMGTNLEQVFQKAPLVRLQFTQKVRERFLVDDQGEEHVMDQPLQSIHQKYEFYRTNFS